MNGRIQPVVRRIASSTSSDQRHAEDDVPVVGHDRAVEELVAARDQVDRGGDARQREQPVPPHDAVAEAPRDREDQEGKEQHEARRGSRAGARGARWRRRCRGGTATSPPPPRRRSAASQPGVPVLDALLALDHLLGARERLRADLRGGLVQPRDLFAHRPPQMKSPASSLDGALARDRSLLELDALLGEILDRAPDARGSTRPRSSGSRA